MIIKVIHSPNSDTLNDCVPFQRGLIHGIPILADMVQATCYFKMFSSPIKDLKHTPILPDLNQP